MVVCFVATFLVVKRVRNSISNTQTDTLARSSVCGLKLWVTNYVALSTELKNKGSTGYMVGSPV